jgi:predicted AlkP superfamily pyrophosphatase or phosphodiesterase
MHLRAATLSAAALLRLTCVSAGGEGDKNGKTYKHVALFSVDGLHSSDLPKWLAAKPKSTIASLLATGYWYSGALTSSPSDSFPGIVNLVAGATPAQSGIWYDDAYGQ